MFDFFKNKYNRDTTGQNLDVKEIREAILKLIKERLQELDGGEGRQIGELSLFVNPPQEELFKYEAAVYTSNPDQFKEEVQRIADNFAIDLPEEWLMQVLVTTAPPAGAVPAKNVHAALLIKNKAVIQAAIANTAGLGLITVLYGKADDENYRLEPGSKRLNIGRERNVQSADGGIRINTIAFAGDAHESNKYISRQHAHIEWDKQAACFMLYADEGGVPPANKTKIRSAQDETLHKLNSIQVGYRLKDGDQVILGESAVLEFKLLNEITELN